MGLDNGIIIKKNAATAKLNLDEMFHYEYDDTELEVVYWRKLWGIRDEIMAHLRIKYPENKEEYHYDLDVEDIKAIIKILEHFDDEEIWEDERASTIWDYHEYLPCLKNNFKALYYLLAKMEDNPGAFTPYFYDSY